VKYPTTPERWVVIELTNPGEEPFLKVLAGWYGGYLGSDEWRFSSLVETIVDNGDHYEFHNLSGSTYLCYKGCYGMSMLMAGTFEYYKKAIEAMGGKLEIVESYNPHAGEDHEYAKKGSDEGEDREEDSVEEAKEDHGHPTPEVGERKEEGGGV
jgi:hypothetical protein